MFLALSDRIQFMFFRLMIHSASVVATTQHVSMFGVPIWTMLRAVTPPSPNCGDDITKKIAAGVSKLVGILMGVGISVSVIGIIVGGLMRATSFGNERRIAMSNTAITCAVVGLVIVLLGATVGNAIPGWFNLPAAPGGTGTADTTGCQISQPS